VSIGRSIARAGAVVALALGALIAASPAHAAEARLQGSVVDPEGEPVAGVKVTLSSSGAGALLEDTTDKKGRFRFLVVDATHPPYVLRLQKEGYQNLEKQVELRIGILNRQDAVMAPSVGSEAAKVRGEGTEAVTAAGQAEVVTLFNAAAALYNEGEVEAAVAKFKEALALNPAFVPALRVLGDLYAGEGRSEEALAVADRLLAIDPADAAAELLRYDALVALDRSPEAEAILTRLIGSGEAAEVAKRLYNLAVTTQRQGDEDRALERFRKAVEVDPALVEAWAAIAVLELGHKEPARAVAAAGKVLEHRPADVEALTVQYEAYKVLGDKVKAAEILERMGVASEDPGVLYRRGVAMFNASNYAQAVEVLEQAVAADPDLAGAHYTLGLALVNQGDNAGALRHLQRFLDLEPDHSDSEAARQMVEYLKGS
jgi:tetratricopeptide (TPR) repeat protein